jgi:hypothetical protein
MPKTFPLMGSKRPFTSFRLIGNPFPSPISSLAKPLPNGPMADAMPHPTTGPTIHHLGITRSKSPLQLPLHRAWL